MSDRRWDVFVSHASEDKQAVAEVLVRALKKAHLRVWYDRMELELGDSLRSRIDEGLAHSRFGVVVLSPSFFAKRWPQLELNGLVQREEGGEKVIVPVWYGITPEQVRRFSPTLADKLAARWSDGVDAVVAQVIGVVHRHAAVPAKRKSKAVPKVAAPTPHMIKVPGGPAVRRPDDPSMVLGIVATLRSDLKRATNARENASKKWYSAEATRRGFAQGRWISEAQKIKAQNRVAEKSAVAQTASDQFTVLFDDFKNRATKLARIHLGSRAAESFSKADSKDLNDIALYLSGLERELRRVKLK